jgi:hypothetical protein
VETVQSNSRDEENRRLNFSPIKNKFRNGKMEKLLVINAHATVDTPDSVSLEVCKHFIVNYRKMNPNESIE